MLNAKDGNAPDLHELRDRRTREHQSQMVGFGFTGTRAIAVCQHPDQMAQSKLLKTMEW